MNAEEEAEWQERERKSDLFFKTFKRDKQERTIETFNVSLDRLEATLNALAGQVRRLNE